MDNGGITTGGSAGVVLRNGNNNLVTTDYNSGARFEFTFIGGQASYQVFDGGGTLNTGIGFRSSGLTLRFTLTGSNSYTLVVYDAAGTTVLGTFANRALGGTSGSSINSFAIYNRHTNDGNVYFNDVGVVVPTWNSSTSGNFSGAGKFTPFAPVNGNSIAFNGGSGTITATNDTLTSVYNIAFNNGTSPNSNATAYVITGDATHATLGINGGIDNNSTSNQTLTTGLTIGASQNFNGTNNTTGALVFGTSPGDSTGAINLQANTLTTTGTTTFNGTVSGTGGSLLVTSGTARLNGINTYTGGTSVTGGILLVNGGVAGTSSGTGTNTVTVNGSGTVLGGTGAISGSVQITVGTITGGTKGTGGTVSAANVGTLSTGALTLASTGIFHADILTTSSFDLVSVAGAVALGGSTLELNIASGLSFTAGQRLTLIANDLNDIIDGTFSGLAQGATVTANGYSFTVDYGGGTGNDFDLVAVPEPSTWAAGILAVAAIGFSQRRRVVRLFSFA